MAKNFSGLDTFFGGTAIDKKKVKEQPTVENKIGTTKKASDATKEGELRATFIVNEDVLEKMKAAAYWDRKKIKDVVNDAFEMYLETRSDLPKILTNRK